MIVILNMDDHTDKDGEPSSEADDGLFCFGEDDISTCHLILEEEEDGYIMTYPTTSESQSFISKWLAYYVGTPYWAVVDSCPACEFSEGTSVQDGNW